MKEAASAAAVARRLSSPTRSSDRRNLDTMSQHTVRRLASPDRGARLGSPKRGGGGGAVAVSKNRFASPEHQRRDAATARRVAARRMGSPPPRNSAALTSPRRSGARPGRPHVTPPLEPWSDRDDSGEQQAVSPQSSGSAAARWKKAGHTTGQAAVAVKRTGPGRISEAEAAGLIAGLSSEPDDEGYEPTTQERVKAARALLMTARSNRANTERLVTMGAVSAVVDLLSLKAVEAQECACLATVAFAETDNGCMMAVEMGALPRLLTMSSSAAGVFDKRVVHSATAALAALARLTANGEELAELRVTELLSALCSALEGGTHAQARVTAETALKLVRLCREGLGYEERGSQGSSVRRAVGELGGISLLVSLLSSTAAPVQLAALDGAILYCFSLLFIVFPFFLLCFAVCFTYFHSFSLK